MVNDRTEATKHLKEIFVRELCEQKLDLQQFEKFVLKEGKKILCEAMSGALENYDNELFASHNREVKVKEKRAKTLASTLGDLTFKRRIYVDKYGNTEMPLDEKLDIGYRSRITPTAFEFLVIMASQVSYQQSANSLAFFGGSQVSANTVMRAIHKTGLNCKNEDIKEAHEIYINGVLPDHGKEVAEVFVEADGTYVSLQNGGKVEVKAMVAYAGKTEESRSQRIDPCRFGCVGTMTEFWSQSFSRFAQAYDITKIKNIHLGFDGEAKYKQAEDYFLVNAKFDGNLDPYHLNRSVRACFGDNKDDYNQVMSCLWHNNPKDAADMLESYSEFGVIDPQKAQIVARYIRNNSQFIKTNEFTLGTMECEQEHMYKCRLAGVPRAWSVHGVDSIARIRSRINSGIELVFYGRYESIPEEVLKHREEKVEEFFAKQPIVYQLTSGHGYNYPYQASLNQKIKQGLCSSWSNYSKRTGGFDPY